MLDSLSSAGWNATDGPLGSESPTSMSGEPIAVRALNQSAMHGSGQAGGPARMGAGMHARYPKRKSKSSGLLAAAIGITLAAFLGFVFYAGVEGLRGDLKGQVTPTISPSSPTVTITASDTFSPESITVRPGTMTFVNDNAGPQVLKAKDSTSFDPVVIFAGERKDVVIADSAVGKTLEVYSETLAADKIVRIAVVSNTPSVTDITSTSASATLTIEQAAVNAATSASAALPATAPVAAHSQATTLSATGLVPTLPLRPAGSQSSSNAPSTNPSRQVPVNPYTVGNAHSGPRPTKNSPSSKSSTLHGGAPLQNLRKPTATTGSGPAVWFITVLALGVMSGVVHVRRLNLL